MPRHKVSPLKREPCQFTCMRTCPQSARVYDTSAPALQGTFAAGAPLLDATFESDGVVFTGGLDGAVKR